MKIKSPKKLIEVALPLREINEAAAREKSIRHGHPSTLHLWWARRPLAAARAVIFAQMVNDPGGERGWAKGVSKAEADARREKLFDIVRRMVKWPKNDDRAGQEDLEKALAEAREEIWNSWRETCALNKGVPGFDPEKLPAFHDPFAGGGALPLEAQRLGLESYASDLNPVAVMINKAMIEIPPKFAGRAPVGPIPQGEEPPDDFATWPGATGLAEDVRRYGYWMREEAKKRIGHLYPPVEITKEMAKNRPDLKQYVGKKLTVIAWLWARTVKSPNPQFAHVDVPLVSSFVLSSRAGKEAYVKPIVQGDKWHFEVCVGKPLKDAEKGTKSDGRSANFNCIVSNTVIRGDYIKAEGMAGRMGSRLMAIVCEGVRGRIYLSPVEEHVEIARQAKPSWLPQGEVPRHLTGGTCVPYGLDKWHKLFTDRQLTALNTFSDLVQEARKKVMADCGDEEYANAISVYLTFTVDKTANYSSIINTYASSGGFIVQTFGRQALPMKWDFAESNPIGDATGCWCSMVDWVYNSLLFLPCRKIGSAVQADAQTQNISVSKLISTDPPYYDNIAYADLSDFFYVWMRRGLKSFYPELFSTITTPKAEELVATPYRHGGRDAAETFFMDGMTVAMHKLATSAHPAFPITIYYAFKQSETNDLGTTNTGWESFLEALIQAGLLIAGTWPINTERPDGLKTGSNVLASSIVLVCRKRAEDAPTVSRTQFIKELRAEMHNALMDMTNGDVDHAPIAPVDLQQAAIGPGMGVFSKYKEIQKMDGSRMTVHEAMLEIMKEIDAFLNPDTALKDVDSSTRFFVEWFKVHGFDDGPFGEAQTLATAKNTTVQYVVDSGVAVSGGGKMRILNWEEYPDDPEYDPREDDNLPLWEACHRVIRELKTGSERTAAALLAKMPAKLSDGIYHLAYYLYDFCTKQGDAANARVYNELATSWEDVLRIKDEILSETEPEKKQGEFDFD